MANTFFGLSIGKKGLYAYQAALNTTAHNASNIDTEGYTRQETVRKAEIPISISNKYGMMGSGVVVDSIKSIRDSYFDTKYRYNNAILANNNTKAYYLDTIQSYFSEVNAEGTTANMDDFFTALSALSNDVGNTTIRTEVTSSANTFVESLNYLYDSLQSTQTEINYEIKTIAEQINVYAEELSSITRQINTVEVRGENANDLRDKRELIIDKLSEYANVTVQEIETSHSVNQYIVKIDGAILVDTYEYFTLSVEAKNTSVNENNIDGLYELVWSSGQKFNSNSHSLGGKLQSLLELRDGNNDKNFNGKTTLKAGDSTITVTSANIQSIAELNIPNENGLISIGNREYAYKSFSIQYNENTKEYEYTFQLQRPLVAEDVHNADKAAELNNGINFKIGEEIAYKGIPYYMAQINEFARTFAKNFNEIHSQGKDLYGNCTNQDFFTATYAGTGEELKLDDTSSIPLDTYYGINAGNFKVAEALMTDAKKIACSASREGTDSGLEDNGIIRQLSELNKDITMFRQGTPSAFLESFTAVLAVSGQEAETFLERQEAILTKAEMQRASISGVDSDEEAMNLVKFKNAYDLCSKVISVMNEIYDKLINQTGV